MLQKDVRAEAGTLTFKEESRWRLRRNIQRGRKKTEGRQVSYEGRGKGDSDQRLSQDTEC